MSLSRIVDLIHEAGAFHIATIDGDSPRVRPFGFIMEFDGKLYFTTNNQKNFYHQLERNPRVEISALPTQDRWIRLSGEAVFDGNAAAKKRAFELYENFKVMYQSPDNPIFEVFYLKEPSATLYSFTTEPEKIL
jgi:uncharacterized pyridoxamine 5'-phosphate oxidase family protein